ncbi:NAD-dependent epimerase/dehydratase family protein [Paenibacillus timonensis]|uniref:NAD-dependent epimerase/dehydratase family protein n=1 Tax=Paenibacillus timonensis TaxID=225915 RepID=UPI003F9A40BD
MKKAILTGGTGFLGFGLLSELVARGVFVYVIVRKNSKRLQRLQGIEGIKVIELNMEDISELASYVDGADAFYHLAWEGGRNDYSAQVNNIQSTIDAMQVAGQIGVKQFVVTGSQAEYGICNDEIHESTPTNPSTAYGACKLATYQILKTLAQQIKISLTWVRVFSVYGPGDNPNTLISYLFKCFKEGQTPQLTCGHQNWDFLYLEDAARALYLLGEKEKEGLFNLASGISRQLKEFVIEVRNLISQNSDLHFDEQKEEQVVQLKVNIAKIKEATEWKPQINFSEGIISLLEGSC